MAYPMYIHSKWLLYIQMVNRALSEHAVEFELHYSAFLTILGQMMNAGVPIENFDMYCIHVYCT